MYGFNVSRNIRKTWGSGNCSRGKCSPRLGLGFGLGLALKLELKGGGGGGGGEGQFSSGAIVLEPKNFKQIFSMRTVHLDFLTVISLFKVCVIASFLITV